MPDRPVSQVPRSEENSNPKSADRPSNARLIAREMTRIGGVGSTVGFVLHTLDRRMQDYHTRTTVNNATPRTPLPSYIKGFSFSLLFKGLSNTLKLSYVKNTVTTQRGKLLDLGDSAPDALESKMTLAEGSKCPSLKTALAVTSGLAAAETALSNYPANVRIWEFQDSLAKSSPNAAPFTKPKLQSYGQHFATLIAAFELRLARNAALMAGLVFMPFLENNFRNVVTNPKERTFLAATLAGGVTGFVCNVIDIFIKNKLILVNPVTFSTPPLWQVIQQNNWRTWGRGAIASVIYTQVAYNTVIAAENGMNKALPFLEQRVDSFCESVRNQAQVATGSSLLHAKRGLKQETLPAATTTAPNAALWKQTPDSHLKPQIEPTGKADLKTPQKPSLPCR